MRLCRFRQLNAVRCGIYEPSRILPLDDLAAVAGEKHVADLLYGGELERLLPIESAAWFAVEDLVKDAYDRSSLVFESWLPRNEVELLPPIARPPKLLLLAGNYAEHITEQGDVAKQRSDTFPYVFMKPATTCMVGDGAEVAIPAQSPNAIDHEVELAVVVGKTLRNANPSEARQGIAGYTIINDLSDRKFHLNPSREERPRDRFFDWMHGKWHDGFCPCGPCLVSADEIQDPQTLRMSLSVDGELRQNGSTKDQIFSVAKVISTLSSWMTLEPGDIVSTGTPSGVGNATGKFLQAGQTVVASIEPIGELTTFMTEAAAVAG